MPIPFLAHDDDVTPFPSVCTALSEPNGLLMAGGNLSSRRLIDAYRQGVFPWFEAGEPILWWSPDPRCVIRADDIRITRSLSKTMRNGTFHITENQSYREVMTRCAAPRAGSTGTWVTDDMVDAYCRLNKMGVAHSIEIWQGETLVGGLYGIQMGRVFIGESMFSIARDASKVALVHLAQCEKYQLIDCQLETAHLNSMGAVCIKRENYIELLNELGNPGASPLDMTEASA
ncbi:MAG: leucyl/phenylalanyl-tRNA--protein transferase [Granulosicoccus sp.]|jgi:leucyl/phenylalanyl-tRNA--protein transferase